MKRPGDELLCVQRSGGNQRMKNDIWSGGINIRIRSGKFDSAKREEKVYSRYYGGFCDSKTKVLRL